MATRNKRIRFMDNQLITNSNVTTSLIDSTLPFSNMLDDGRFKTTRFTGTFEITTSNRNIYINDGTNHTVQVTSGLYSGGDLASEIQTRLNAVSSNWECTYDSNSYLFTINRSSGTRTLRLSVTTNACWDTLGYTGSIDKTAAALPADESRVHTSDWIEIDLGNNANDIGFFGLVTPTNSVFPLSNSATITLMGSNVASWTSPAVSFSLSQNDAGLLKFLDPATGDMRYRFWRLEWTDRLNANGAGWEFSSIYLGTYLTLGKRNVNSGFSRQHRDLSTALQTESGAVYNNIRQRYVELSALTINYADADDRLNLEQFFYDFGLHRPFWVSIDPTEACHTLEELTRYVYFSAEPSFNHFKTNIYSMNFSVRDAV